MYINSKKVVKIINEIAPMNLAESWDNVGFQVGDIDREIDKVMVALEVTDKVIDECIRKNVDLLVVHHPLIFKPLKTVRKDEPHSKLVYRLIQNNINLFVAHTNLDIADYGTNDYYCKLLGLKDIKPMKITNQTVLFKLQTYVPEASANMLIKVLSLAGGGEIGNYSECCFQSKGTGQFKPNIGSNPSVGSVGELERVDEIKIEMIVPENKLSSVIAELKENHPYEEPAYDIIGLSNNFNLKGLGRVGYLEDGMKFEEFASFLKDKMGYKFIKYSGRKTAFVKKIGICTGAGSDLFDLAKSIKCDVYITGDIKYHEAQYAKQLKLNVIDAGHFETENIYKSFFKKLLIEKFEQKNYTVKVIESEENINPFDYSF